VSFGSDELFARESGERGEKYLEWLRDRIAEFPEGFVHAWQGDAIIGQLEVRPKGAPGNGYINLFYLVPEARGTGVGHTLHDHALAVLRHHGVRIAQLSVSPTNARAVRYYAKHGWRDLGPRPGHEEVHLMEREL
jgi:ribosomal protein S18 acetylase RimI-like enzyme